MNNSTIRIFIFLIVLFISMNITNGFSYNHSLLIKQLLNRTTNIHSWKKSNSIEILKKLIANRQIITKYNRTLFLTNTTQRIPFVSSSIQVNSTIINIEYFSTTQIHFLVFSTLLQKSKESSNLTTLVIIFVCSFSGFLFLTITFTFLFRQYVNNSYFKLPCIYSLSTTKQSRNSTPLSYSSIDSRFTIPEEFSVDQLYDIYMQKHALDDLGFSMEFKSIPTFDEFSCTSASRSIVASKNRFVNILPIDTTRVILNILNNDPSTDYINGNYISGYKSPNKFIATQGPKPETCEDFWRMIWELKLKSIVILTNITEGSLRMTKCHQYWPELNQTITYDSYQITCIDNQSFIDYEKRLFQLLKIREISPSSSLHPTDNEQDIRLIIQYHYTQWKDMDVPDHSHTLLHLINEVNQQTNSNEYPIVVHCTAGVGRTGTYIAIDGMIEKIREEKKVDIYNFVLQMRRERHLMVQTVKQYVFIYRSLLEYYFYGDTRIEGNFFQTIYSNFKKNKQNLLISEYNKLSLLSNENISHHHAYLPENIKKNRHKQIIPYDRNRVCLSQILGHPYINASFIEGYSFILTQDPLSETIDEFWRIFIEHDSNCIVQLHTIIDLKPKCASYYPDQIDRTMKIGLTSLLRLLSKEIIEDKFIIRQFYLTDTRESLTKIIFHYEYLLPIHTNDGYEYGQCIPTLLTHSFFDFIGQINKRLDHRYITIHCGNGGPSCSIFCLSMILLDQLKSEHAVDIFQSVRAFQRQRPAMITSFIQYEYLYEMISKFLEESFDLTNEKLSLSLNNSIYDNDQENSSSLTMSL